MKFKPLRAGKVDFGKLRYPVLASPKLDGIRCLIINGMAYSISLKPIPNQHVQKCLSGMHGLDGELMLSDVNADFNEIQSAIMSRDGKPDFKYFVFDTFDDSLVNEPYSERIASLYDFIGNCESSLSPIQCLPHVEFVNGSGLWEQFARWLSSGYEGAMVRDPKGKYKFGRSTVKEQILLKLKAFHDDEGVLVEVVEQMRNNNKLERDELGYAKRSTKKANMVPAGTAGKVIVKWRDKEIDLGFGPGLTAAFKSQLWENRESLKGEIVKFSYQNLSKLGVPRFGKMLGFRHEDDL